MHEGLLILSKADQNVMFCNKPSQKLLEGAISYLEACQETREKCYDAEDEVQKQLLKHAVFYPFKVVA